MCASGPSDDSKNRRIHVPSSPGSGIIATTAGADDAISCHLGSRVAGPLSRVHGLLIRIQFRVRPTERQRGQIPDCRAQWRLLFVAVGQAEGAAMGSVLHQRPAKHRLVGRSKLPQADICRLLQAFRVRNIAY